MRPGLVFILASGGARFAIAMRRPSLTSRTWPAQPGQALIWIPRASSTPRSAT